MTENLTEQLIYECADGSWADAIRLIKRGADPDVPGRSGKTARDYIESAPAGFRARFEELIEQQKRK